MTIRKERLTVTVDRALVRAGARAVSKRRADSLSSWVNTALTEHVVKTRRLEALADAVAHYEREFGVITDGELLAQERADRQEGRVVRVRSRKASGRGER